MMRSTLISPQWSLSKKYLFRFFFILLFLLIFLNNNGAFLYVQQLTFYPTKFLHQFIPWFSKTIVGYHYDYSIYTNGSGDTSYNYVLLLFLILASLVGSIIWSFLDYKRANYVKLYYWLIVLVRYYLAFTLILYGSIKIIQLQFPQPTLHRLLQPFGEASPMGLAWTFLGFSNGYNIFMGIIEVSAALLLFRRTMVIGAFIALAASVNIMAINYFFDVPVKLLSTTLVAMSLFILTPYVITISKFFLFQEPQQLNPLQPPSFPKKWHKITFIAFKCLIIVWTVTVMVNNILFQQNASGIDAPKPPLYGIYNVDKYIINGREVAPLATDKDRWKQMVIEYKDFAAIRTMDGDNAYFNMLLNQKDKKLELNSENLASAQYKFNYKFENDSTIIMSGTKNRDSIVIKLRKYNLKNFKLINRGFHWINEHPNNH